MLMWEVLYESIPFDGVLKDAIEFVVDEDARPRIVTLGNNVGESTSKFTDEVRESQAISVANNEEETLQLTEDLANIIRKCWQSDPTERLPFSTVVKLLQEQ